MKKKIIISVIVLVVVAICVLAYGYISGTRELPEFIKEQVSDDNETDMDRIKKIMETTRPTQVMVLGDEIKFENEIDIKKIDGLTESEIESEKDYVIVLINDLYDNVTLSDEEVEFAKELINKDGYCIIYLGEKYSTVLDKTDEGIAEIEGNLCFMYYSWQGMPSRNVGSWLQSDQDDLEKYPFMLGQALMYCMEMYLTAGEISK